MQRTGILMVRTLQWAWRVVRVRTYAGGLYTEVLGEIEI